MGERSAFRGSQIVGIAALAQGVSVGSTFYAYGPFLKPLAAEFDASRLVVTLGLTCMTIVQGLAAPFIGRAFDRGSARALMISGVVSLAAGLMLFSQTSAFWQAVLLFMLPIAIGAHLFGPLAASTLVARWFVRQRGTALGVTSLGAAAGGAAFPPLATALIEALGWRGAIGTLGAGLLLVIPALAWFVIARPEDVGETPDGDAPSLGPATTPVPAEGTTADGRGAADPATAPMPEVVPPPPPQPLSTRSLVRDPRLWAITVTIGAGYVPVSVLLVHLVPFATDLGFSPERAASLLTGYAIASAFGRVLFGWLADRMDPRIVVWLNFGWFSLAWLGLLVEPSYPLLLATALAAGISVGGITPLWAVLTGAVYGRDAFGRAMGLTNMLMVPFSVAGAPIAAHVFDRTGSYRAGFAGFLVCFVLGSIAIAFLGRARGTERG
ncbi:MAG: MFS transporter [Myxococcota bacterium]